MRNSGANLMIMPILIKRMKAKIKNFNARAFGCEILGFRPITLVTREQRFLDIAGI